MTLGLGCPKQAFAKIATPRLIDCRARCGQSGSLVIYYIKIGQIEYDNGFTAVAKAEQSHLLGIYSGRINKESDLGIVWKTSVLREIITDGEISAEGSQFSK